MDAKKEIICDGSVLELDRFDMSRLAYDQNKDFFSNNLNLRLDINEVLIAENSIIKNLNGDVSFEKNYVNK